MESYLLDICSREQGLLLQNKTFVPLNGPLLSISNSSHNKIVSFVHAAWDKSSSKIVAGDSFGNIYLFYLQKNKFVLLYHWHNACCTFLTFSPDRRQDIIVALSDCSVVSLNSDSKTIENQFNHHISCVTYISFDKSGQKVLSCSKDQAILWNLSTFQILRYLSLKKSIDIVKVFFHPTEDIIILAFKDSSVFLWSSENFICTSRFICTSEDIPLNMKCIDISSDGKLLACAGKANWFIIWNTEENKRLYTVLLPSSVIMVKQIYFLMCLQGLTEGYILSLLSHDGEVLIYNIKDMELLHKLSCINGKTISFAPSMTSFQILMISLNGSLELYDLEEFITVKSREKPQDVKKRPQQKYQKVSKLPRKKAEAEKQDSPALNKKKLLSIVKNFGEYPEKHRFFIWSQLLELPNNKDAFNVLHQESLQITSFNKDYSFMNPGVQKTFSRIMSMLVCWHPIIQEIEYYQCIAFPFIKVLHKSPVRCFEILVTLIGNWCQNWFLFCPFPPFNILCVIENIISYHDQKLMRHFMQLNISAEIYGWNLLQTSFSEVFNKRQWLKLWDNIFSNDIGFLMYCAAAFNIVMRDVLLRCKTLEQFKGCYRKHGISASILIQKAYDLQHSSPPEIDPEPVVGSFASIPKGAYPTFFQMSQMKIDLQTLTRKRIIDQEIHFMQQREDAIEITHNYLKELQDLQLIRRKLLLDCIDWTDVDALEVLHKKLIKVQNLIQSNLTDQVAMLKGLIGENIFSDGKEDARTQYFRFKEYVKKLRAKTE